MRGSLHALIRESFMDLFIESDVARITVHLPHTPEEQQYLVEGKELESDLER